MPEPRGVGRGELCDYLGVACITTWLRVFSPMRIRAVRKKRHRMRSPTCIPRSPRSPRPSTFAKVSPPSDSVFRWRLSCERRAYHNRLSHRHPRLHSLHSSRSSLPSDRKTPRGLLYAHTCLLPSNACYLDTASKNTAPQVATMMARRSHDCIHRHGGTSTVGAGSMHSGYGNNGELAVLGGNWVLPGPRPRWETPPSSHG